MPFISTQSHSHSSALLTLVQGSLAQASSLTPPRTKLGHCPLNCLARPMFRPKLVILTHFTPNRQTPYPLHYSPIAKIASFLHQQPLYHSCPPLSDHSPSLASCIKPSKNPTPLPLQTSKPMVNPQHTHSSTPSI